MLGQTYYPGKRYDDAMKRIRDLLERADNGDAKAISDLVHAAEYHLMKEPLLMILRMLEPLDGVKAASDARARLGSLLSTSFDDLSDNVMALGKRANGIDP